jgi:hypothetical protein|tara:strand:+ start:3559 stop:3807 length:249 start_codon:yes stop_codon:yes gene_type:complete
MIISFVVQSMSHNKTYFVTHNTKTFAEWRHEKHGKPSKKFIPTKENIEDEWEQFVERYPKFIDEVFGSWGLVGAVKGEVNWL